MTDKTRVPDHSVRIMMADDHYPDVVLVKEALKSQGLQFEMDVLGNGESALAHLLAAEGGAPKPDLIVLDLNLSRFSGLEVLAQIRGRRFFDATPVALLTSSLSASQRTQALQMGADIFLSKPTHLDEFLSIVGTALKALLYPNSNTTTRTTPL